MHLHGSILIVHVSLGSLNFYRHTTLLNGYHGVVIMVNNAHVSTFGAHTTTMLADKYLNILNYSAFRMIEQFYDFLKIFWLIWPYC